LLSSSNTHHILPEKIQLVALQPSDLLAKVLDLHDRLVAGRAAHHGRLDAIQAQGARLGGGLRRTHALQPGITVYVGGTAIQVDHRVQIHAVQAGIIARLRHGGHCNHSVLGGTHCCRHHAHSGSILGQESAIGGAIVVVRLAGGDVRGGGGGLVRGLGLG